MPTTYELYLQSVAKRGVYDANTIALRRKLESEILSAHNDAQVLASTLPYNAHVPEKQIDDYTNKELIDAALEPDKTPTDDERVELYETFAKKTLAPDKVKESTKQYKSDLKGVEQPVDNQPIVDQYTSEKPYWRGKYLGGGKVSDLFDILRTLEYAAGGVIARTREAAEIVKRAQDQGRKMTPEESKEYFKLAGVSIGSIRYGIEHRISPSAALDIKNPVAALLVDIGLDLTTYLTMGTSGALKIGVHGAEKAAAELGIKTSGKVAIRKEGVEVIERMVRSGRYSYDEASELLLEWMAKHPQDAAKWIHPGGIRFAGVPMVAGKTLEKGWDVITGLRYVGAPMRTAGSATMRGYEFAEKLPSRAARAVARPVFGASSWAIPKATTPIRRKATQVTDWIGRSFVLGYELKRSGEEGAAYFRDWLDWAHRKKGAQAQAFADLRELAGDYAKRGKDITKYIEEGVSTGSAEFDKYIEDVIKPHAEKMRLEEVARNIDTGELLGYVPHVLTKKGKKILKERGTISEVYRYYGQKVRAHYAEAREIPGTIREINEELGVKFFEEDYWKAMVQREQKHIADIYTADWFKYVQRKYGIEAPITSVKQVFTGKYKEAPLEVGIYEKIDDAIEEAYRNVPSPFKYEEVSRVTPFEELIKITGELENILTPESLAKTESPTLQPLKEFIESEKTGLFKGTYKSSKRKVRELEELISNYREIYGDVAKRKEWISTHLGDLRALKIQPTGEEDVEVFEKFLTQRIGQTLHDIVMLPSASKASMERVFKRPVLRSSKELQKIEDDFIKSLEHITGLYKGRRKVGEPIYEDVVTRATTVTDKGIDYVLSKHPQLREKLLPAAIAKHLEEMVESPRDEPVRDILRWLHSWWKRTVTTGIGPAIHTAFFGRNI
ncbi:MAG TPA: hypothetical protein ENL17_02935, partial [Candidatus Methanoperedenaceae archaeon]|nr:hypothetical protein [Candidatus Methanoperedenaceae archaeon]